MWTSFWNTIRCIFERYKFLKYLAFFMILGSIIGSLIANVFIDCDSSSNLSNLIGSFFTNCTSNILDNDYSFWKCFFKNIKYLIIIWILGFAKLGVLFIFVLIVLKGISYGFTMAFFIIEFGILGIFYACLFYLLQNIILIPFHFYVSLKACTYSSRKFYKHKNSHTLRKYLLILVFVLIVSIIISLFDVIVCPKIISLCI